MADGKKGWNIGDPQKFVAEYNRKSLLKSFPEQDRWQQVQGISFQPVSELNPEPLVAIHALDHRREPTTVWMSQANAQYLLTLLYSLARERDLPSQMTMAPPTKPLP